MEHLKVKWHSLPVFGKFKDGEDVWFRSYIKHTWKGKYDEFETHKNGFGDYPIEVAKRNKNEVYKPK